MYVTFVVHEDREGKYVIEESESSNVVVFFAVLSIEIQLAEKPLLR